MSIKANSTSTTKFPDLWPVPSAPPFLSSPTRIAGVTPEATQKLRDLLKLNHENWHIFYDAVGRHDHMTHHLIALWSLGADANVLQAAYDLHVVLQVPVGGENAESITKENVFDHLGDRMYYKAYMDFFTEVVRERGPVATIEEYVFSDKANFESTNKDGKHPEMLNRFHGGLLHAIIHVGYGVEFGIPGMVVEGLAQTAVNEASNAAMIPPSLFVQPDTVNGASSPAKNNLHAFTVLGRVLKDERFEIKFEDFRSAFIQIIIKCGSACANYATDWLPDMHPSPELMQQKIQELEWAATVMSVVPGFEEGKEYNADFVGMHLVTSSVFMGSLVPSLEPRSQALLLRAYFAVLIAVWTLLGRPQLDFESFFATSPAFEGPHHVPAPTKFALAPSTNPNPWLDIIHQALVHPDDHVSKFQRAMHHYALKYGSVHAGQFANTELSGADKIDGTLFVKGAMLTAQRVAQEVDELPDQMSFWDRRTYRREVIENVY
ncbi:hypothetical protein VNI00_006681 [Paramarasmius palmivorus]|uniref:Oxidoreductase AflY n=1 Tax=Paramarasmius palmivorus TaxID=297713 RepID=A0AAW0D8H8_9AGAR